MKIVLSVVGFDADVFPVMTFQRVKSLQSSHLTQSSLFYHMKKSSVSQQHTFELILYMFFDTSSFIIQVSVSLLKGLMVAEFMRGRFSPSTSPALYFPSSDLRCLSAGELFPRLSLKGCAAPTALLISPPSDLPSDCVDVAQPSLCVCNRVVACGCVFRGCFVLSVDECSVCFCCLFLY